MALVTSFQVASDFKAELIHYMDNCENIADFKGIVSKLTIKYMDNCENIADFKGIVSKLTIKFWMCKKCGKMKYYY
jgi:hypothetical protein